MKHVLIIDNYDSFTWNLVEGLRCGGARATVCKNDEITTTQAQKLAPDAVIFSPGPGTATTQKDVGNGPEIFQLFRGKIPQLGVCLGHQMMGQLLGAKEAQTEPKHGKKWEIQILKPEGIFKNFPEEVQGMRYHSLILKNLPPELELTAQTPEGDIMAFQNKAEKVYGVQFHPESVGTPQGLQILGNFLSI